MRQSMLRRRWYSQVPTMPVKRKLKSEVAAAWWMVSPPKSARNYTISTPPTPTVPMSTPTNAATAASRRAELRQQVCADACASMHPWDSNEDLHRFGQP